MVDLGEIQAVYYMVAATGVIVAAIYYVYNMRISQRNSALVLKAQEQTLETRQAQLYMQLFQSLNSEEFIKRYIDLLNMEWSDYDDFEKKYGSDEHPENFAKRFSTFYLYDGVGYLLQRGLLDEETAYRLCGLASCYVWKKYEKVIKEQEGSGGPFLEFRVFGRRDG